PPTAPLFPYTTLFRSVDARSGRRGRPLRPPLRRQPRRGPPPDAEPHLPAGEPHDRGHAGVRGHGGPLRLPPRGPLRPRGPRHAAVAARARPPAGAVAPPLVLRRPHLPALPTRRAAGLR